MSRKYRPEQCPKCEHLVDLHKCNSAPGYGADFYTKGVVLKGSTTLKCGEFKESNNEPSK